MGKWLWWMKKKLKSLKCLPENDPTADAPSCFGVSQQENCCRMCVFSERCLYEFMSEKINLVKQQDPIGFEIFRKKLYDNSFLYAKVNDVD